MGKINRLLKNTKKFGFGYVYSLAWLQISNKLKFKGRIKEHFHNKHHKSILKYLKRKYGYVLDKYKANIECAENTPKIIWCCWWQGYDNAPDIVKKCIASVRKENPDCDIRFVDSKNYLEYISVPQMILDKIESKVMTITSFSDYIRMSLLAKYGGVWMDSTIFAIDKLPNEMFTSKFYSQKSKIKNFDGEFVSNENWTGYFISGNKEFPLFHFVVDFYNEYFAHEESQSWYLLIDYVIKLAHDNISIVQKEMDKVQPNNEYILKLQKLLSNAYDESLLYDLKESGTVVCKLSWKDKFDLVTPNGEKTFFAYLLEGKLHSATLNGVNND